MQIRKETFAFVLVLLVCSCTNGVNFEGGKSYNVEFSPKGEGIEPKESVLDSLLNSSSQGKIGIESRILIKLGDSIYYSSESKELQKDKDNK